LWAKKILLGKLSKYYIIDFPWVLSFQAFFLKKVLGGDKVAFWNDEVEKRSNAEVILCSAFQYKEFLNEEPPIKVFVNQDSLPEMSSDIAMMYIQWIFSRKEALFFSYQQENGTRVNGDSQNCIHKMISVINNAKLIARNLSWTRSGYTEEIYKIV
jgi:ASC-1-like (ASCH) protein